MNCKIVEGEGEKHVSEAKYNELLVSPTISESAESFISHCIRNIFLVTKALCSTSSIIV